MSDSSTVEPIPIVKALVQAVMKARAKDYNGTTESLPFRGTTVEHFWEYMHELRDVDEELAKEFEDVYLGLAPSMHDTANLVLSGLEGGEGSEVIPLTVYSGEGSLEGVAELVRRNPNVIAGSFLGQATTIDTPKLVAELCESDGSWQIGNKITKTLALAGADAVIMHLYSSAAELSRIYTLLPPDPNGTSMARTEDAQQAAILNFDEAKSALETAWAGFNTAYGPLLDRMTRAPDAYQTPQSRYNYIKSDATYVRALHDLRLSARNMVKSSVVGHWLALQET